MLNFVYCLDENYNKQSLCSIYSLLENVDEKIRVSLIHKNPESISGLVEKISQHQNLSSLNIKKRIMKNTYYPKLSGAHVSEATYYRLNIEEYFLQEEIIIYLDSDVIFIDNPINLFKKEIKNLINSKQIIAAKTEKSLISHGKNILGMSSIKYFNAGVMVIDLKKWRGSDISEKLYSSLHKLGEDIVFWDQDVLNHYFDGSFEELDPKLNYQVEMSKNNIHKNDISSIVLLHYSGKFKPWSVMGATIQEAVFFQNLYRELFDEKYFISYNYKVNALKDFMRVLLSFRIFRIKFKMSFIAIVLKSFFGGHD